MQERKTQDRRVRKTKREIRLAFAKLLTEKNLTEITVRDIAEEADINRKTFYNHYAGIYAVVDEIENDIVSQLSELLGELDFGKEMIDPFPMYEKFTALINQDLDFYGTLIQENQGLIAKMGQLLREKMQKTLMEKTRIDEGAASIVLEYTLAGTLAVYRNWFLSDRQQSIEEIAKTVGALCFQGFNGARKDLLERSEQE